MRFPLASYMPTFLVILKDILSTCRLAVVWYTSQKQALCRHCSGMHVQHSTTAYSYGYLQNVFLPNTSPLVLDDLTLRLLMSHIYIYIYIYLVPKFAGSNPAEAVGFLRAKKSSARLPSEGK